MGVSLNEDRDAFKAAVWSQHCPERLQILAGRLSLSSAVIPHSPAVSGTRYYQ